MPEEALAGLAEVAEMLNVAKRTAQRYAKRNDFPRPIATLAATPVWRRSDIEAWKKAKLPLARDPRGKRR